MKPGAPAFTTSEQGEHRETALTAWQAQLRRLRLLITQADELTPSAFVKAVHEVLPELREAAMETIIYDYINSYTREEQREDLRQSRQA